MFKTYTLIKFENGKYGLLKREFFFWKSFVDLKSPRSSWDMDSYYFPTDCQGTEEEAKEALEKIQEAAIENKKRTTYHVVQLTPPKPPEPEVEISPPSYSPIQIKPVINCTCNPMHTYEEIPEETPSFCEAPNCIYRYSKN